MNTLVCLGDSITAKERDFEGGIEVNTQVTSKVADSTKSNFIDFYLVMRSQPNYPRFLKSKNEVHFNQQHYEFFAPILVENIRLISMEFISF